MSHTKDENDSSLQNKMPEISHIILGAVHNYQHFHKCTKGTLFLTPKCTTKINQKLYSQKTLINVSWSFLFIYSCNHFFSQNGFHSEMLYRHLLYLKSKHCYLPLPQVYGLYTCENVDNCERSLISCAGVNVFFA